jgi:DNA-binding transcriptional LysR family regulator
MDKLRAIALFCRAVEAKSFTAAAHSLDLAPSVLSKTIAALEAELECRLFNRTTRRTALTQAGAAYYEQCRKLLSGLEEAEAVARDGSVAGVLKVGVHPAIRALLMRRLGELCSANPRMAIEIVVTNSAAALVDEGLDVVLRIGELADSTFVAHRLGWTQSMICAAPSYVAQHGRPRHPTELARLRAIIPGRRDEDSFARWSFSRGGERIAVAVPAALVARDGIGLVDAAAGGVGIARIYDLSARPYLESKSLVPLLHGWSSERAPIFAIRSAGRAPRKVRAFLEFARELVSTQQGEPLDKLR